jgi:hypothetical protein
MADPMTMFLLLNGIKNIAQTGFGLLNRPKLPSVPNYSGMLESIGLRKSGTYLNRSKEGLRQLADSLANSNLPPSIAAKIIARAKDETYRNASDIESQYYEKALQGQGREYEQKFRNELTDTQYVGNLLNSLFGNIGQMIETKTIYDIKEKESARKSAAQDEFLKMLQDILSKLGGE